MKTRIAIAVSALALGMTSAATVAVKAQAPAAGAQAPAAGQAPAGAPGSGRAQAPAQVDLTGTWVSIVTEDWRWRMVTPPKGDYASVPITVQGRKVADTWDPAKDEAAGLQCKAYGAGNIMRVPGRVRITWQDDNTLKIETDAGQQTRLLRFGQSEPPAQPSLQGHSVANWELPGAGGGGFGGGGGGGGGGGARGGDGGGRGGGRGGRGGPQWASLKVVTTHVTPGYLRKNGVPYSEKTTVTEYFDRHTESNGDWFTVTTIVDDPLYLNQPFITSSSFRKEPDASKWSPAPCSAR